MNNIQLQCILFICLGKAMFSAAELDREPVMSAIAGSEHHVFKSINLTSSVPHFWASIVAELEGMPIETQQFLSCVDDVADLLACASEDGYRIKRLRLISPPWLNCSEEWLAEPLGKVAVGHHPIHGRIVTYQLANSCKTYVDGFGISPDGNIQDTNLENVFTFDPPSKSNQA